MKKVEISGVAKVEAYKSAKGDFANLKINGTELEMLLVDKLLENNEGEWPAENSLCQINITIKPYDAELVVNGQVTKLEL
jgi:hypothetical protein